MIDLIFVFLQEDSEKPRDDIETCVLSSDENKLDSTMDLETDKSDADGDEFLNSWLKALSGDLRAKKTDWSIKR